MDSSPVPLVWNGWDTNKVIYPWHATMYHYNDGNWETWCGGTLITEKLILTGVLFFSVAIYHDIYNNNILNP